MGRRSTIIFCPFLASLKDHKEWTLVLSISCERDSELISSIPSQWDVQVWTQHLLQQVPGIQVPLASWLLPYRNKTHLTSLNFIGNDPTSYHIQHNLNFVVQMESTGTQLVWTLLVCFLTCNQPATKKLGVHHLWHQKLHSYLTERPSFLWPEKIQLRYRLTL